LEKEVTIDIGLKLEILNLSPFLNTGCTIENFNLAGKTPQERDLLHTCVKGELMNGALNFRILTEISSHP
jgi:hypothetical protein